MLPKNSSCNISSFKEDNYKIHITKSVSVSFDNKGLVIIPLEYITQIFPTIPQEKYPYEKMTGETWNHYLCKDDWEIL